MGVPGGIEKGTDGADDPASWTERCNSPGPEWRAPGDGETLEDNADGRKPGPVGGNTFVVVEADGEELFDMRADPGQFTNLAGQPAQAATLARFRTLMKAKLKAVRNNDLGLTY